MRTDSLITAAVLPVLAMTYPGKQSFLQSSGRGVGGSMGKWDRVFHILSNLIPKLAEDSEVRKDTTFFFLLYLGFDCTLKCKFLL